MFAEDAEYPTSRQTLNQVDLFERNGEWRMNGTKKEFLYYKVSHLILKERPSIY
jgi:hypothetical protein